MDLRSLVHDLIHCQRQKIAKHDIHHRAHTGHRRTDAESGETRLGYGSIYHTVLPKLLHQTGQNFERRARFRHIFADDENMWIAAQFLCQGLIDRLGKSQLALCDSFSRLIDIKHRRPARLLPAGGKQH
jgi:hypothetical protein